MQQALAAGVEHYVYTSVGSANKNTGIPHFDNKARVEDALRAEEFPSHAIIRPVFFMENLLSPWFLQEDKLATAMKPTTKLQMVAVDDIGKFGAQAFIDSAQWKGVEVDIAGDAITMVEAAGLVSEIVKKKLTFQEIPIEAVRQNSEDFALMLEWVYLLKLNLYEGCDTKLGGTEFRDPVPIATMNDQTPFRLRFEGSGFDACCGLHPGTENQFTSMVKYRAVLLGRQV